MLKKTTIATSVNSGAKIRARRLVHCSARSDVRDASGGAAGAGRVPGVGPISTVCELFDSIAPQLSYSALSDRSGFGIGLALGRFHEQILADWLRRKLPRDTTLGHNHDAIGLGDHRFWFG